MNSDYELYTNNKTSLTLYILYLQSNCELAGFIYQLMLIAGSLMAIGWHYMLIKWIHSDSGRANLFR